VSDLCEMALETNKLAYFLFFKPYAVDGHLEKLGVDFNRRGSLDIVMSNLKFLKVSVLRVHPIAIFVSPS
jgi:hypothetical protein